MGNKKVKQPSFSSIGKSAPRIEGEKKVSGEALYTADNLLPGTLWGKVLRSPYPHARIIRLDTSRAKAHPGVMAVLTAADIPDSANRSPAARHAHAGAGASAFHRRESCGGGRRRTAMLPKKRRN